MPPRRPTVSVEWILDRCDQELDAVHRIVLLLFLLKLVHNESEYAVKREAFGDTGLD